MGKYSIKQNKQSCRKVNTDTYEIRYLKNKKIYADGKITYTVVWKDGTETPDINSDDISKQPKENYEIITNHNNNTVKKFNKTNTFLSSKKALLYNRISYDNNNYITTTNNIFLNSSAGGSAGGSSIQSIDVCDSIKTQQQVCLDYCKETGILIKDIAIDIGISARNMKNYETGQLGISCSYLTPNSCIIIYTPDRLSRNGALALQFLNIMESKNIDVHFVKENIVWNTKTASQDKMTIRTILNTAEYLSDQTSERIKTTIARKRKEGHYFGTPEYGTKIEINSLGIRKKINCNIEQAIIKDIIKMYKSNLKIFSVKSKNYNNILHSLNTKKIKKRNKDFNKNKIETIIRNYINQSNDSSSRFNTSFNSLLTGFSNITTNSIDIDNNNDISIESNQEMNVSTYDNKPSYISMFTSLFGL